MFYRACFLGILLLIATPGGAHAAPALQFSASLTGTQTCADFDTAKLKQTVFVSYDGSSFNVYRDSNFSSLYVSLQIFEVYQIGQGSIDTFTVGAFSSSPHAALFEGTVKISNKSFTAVGAFIDYDETNVPECMNYGVLKSLKLTF